MKRLIAHRPTPATAIACVALFVSLGGVSYGVATGSIDSREVKDESLQGRDVRRGSLQASDIRNDSLRTEDLRNNEIRGLDIRNSTIRGIEIALNSITGADIAENTLDTVPNAASAGSAATAGTAGTADKLDGLDSSAFARPGDLGRFSVRLGAGESQTVATHGQVSVVAQCNDEAGTTSDSVRLLAETTSSEAVMAGADDHPGTGNFLTSTTAAGNRELLTRARTLSTDVGNADGNGFVAGPDGRGLHVSGEATLLGFNYAGAACIVAGELSKTG